MEGRGTIMEPLHEAAARGYYEDVTLLLDRGANVNAADGCGLTP